MFIVTILLVVIIFCVNSHTFSQSEKKPVIRKIFISTVKAKDVSAEIAEKVKSNIRLSIFENYGSNYYVYDDETVGVVFSQVEKIMATCADPKCLKDIGDIMNVDELVFGEVSKDGSRIRVNFTNLERKQSNFVPKSMVSFSFFESILPFCSREIGKKLIDPKYVINISGATAEIDDTARLSAIKVEKVEGLDLSLITFKSTDESIGMIVDYLKELAARGDVEYAKKNYSGARQIYVEVNQKAETKLMPEKRKMIKQFLNGISTRIDLTYMIETKEGFYQVDDLFKVKKEFTKAELQDIKSKYENLYFVYPDRLGCRGGNVCEKWQKYIYPYQKAREDRITAINNILRAQEEKPGDIAYSEFRFEDAIKIYIKLRGNSNRLYDDSRGKLRLSKKIYSVNNTGISFINNKVKLILDQAQYFHLREDNNNVKSLMKKARELILASDFQTTQIVDRYNEVAGFLQQDAVEIDYEKINSKISKLFIKHRDNQQDNEPFKDEDYYLVLKLINSAKTITFATESVSYGGVRDRDALKWGIIQLVAAGYYDLIKILKDRGLGSVWSEELYDGSPDAYVVKVITELLRSCDVDVVKWLYGSMSCPYQTDTAIFEAISN